MKKFIALLLLACLAASLAACDIFKGATNDDPSELVSDPTVSDESESGSESESESTEDTSKGLFVSSLVGAIKAPTAEFPTFPEVTGENGDTVLDISLKLDSLKNDGHELLPSDGSAVSATLRADTDEMREDCTLTLELSGEELGTRLLYDRTGIYVTDIFGLSKKFYKLAEVSNVEVLEPNEMHGATSGNAYEEAFASLLKVISDNVDESMFTLKVKNVKIGDAEYSDAQVLTLTVDDGTLRRICNEWVSDVKNNEESGSILTDADADAIKKAVEGIKSIVITSNIVDGKCLSISFESPIVKLDTRGNELAKKTNKGELIFNENGFDLQLKLYGLSDESFEDYLNLDVKYENVGNDFDISVIGSSLFGVPRDIFDAEFTVADGVLDGSFGILSDEEFISFDLCIKGGSEQAEISLKDLHSTVDGVETADSLDAELIFSASDNGYGISAEFELAAGYEDGILEARGSASIDVQYTDVDIDPPTTPLGELDELLSLIEEAGYKYQDTIMEYEELFEFFSRLIANADTDVEFKSDEGISIRLPYDFEQDAYELGYSTVRWDNYDTAIFANRANKKLLNAYGIFTAQQYLEYVHEYASYLKVSPITEKDGLFYFEAYYVDQANDENIKTMVAAYVSDTDFWYVEVCTFEEYFDDLSDDYIKWLKSVEVFTPTDSSQGSDGDL